jgi:lysophospholipase L1-like esterase
MSRKRKAIYALFTLLAVFGLAEGTLRLAGFSYQRVTTYLEFNYPRPGFLKAFFEIDPDLLYRIRPTVKQRGIHLTWQPRFDLKIRDPRIFGPKPPGYLRVVALGDSSTYGVNTPDPWPKLLQQRLDSGPAAGRVEVLNLGVPGYTLFQGRRVLETRGRRLEPDVVVIYFGWNDHILALGYTDAEQKVGGAAVVTTRNRLADIRVYQALSWLVATVRGDDAAPSASTGSGHAPSPVSGGSPNRPRGPRSAPEPRGGRIDPLLAPKRRVSPADFEADLREMVTRCHSLGAVPVLCTYPTALSFLESRGLPPPEWLPETHVGYGGIEEVLRLQTIYNQAVRDVARTTRSPLVDLEGAFEEGGKEHLFDNPAGDMIHPNRQGYALVAELVHQAVLQVAAGR